ncbi:myo-inosose-2 dehydratase [Glaesserella parasuis]|uniref:myo-inosose-2 dehydratase n=1 Tax=Glaesserella parasuis TaxID=738 RepID=UPI0013656D82|nr:myo-inosose-2 dehydratase [Glaesserella parasuis]MDO9746996.1 myo-inosose-2 dehydratase [Glaesserella parasuis]MDO9771263.1 myo-inosose-2 dehydratase [Glaesserella parasuis]MDO9773401.1 myo-inosose-2 dehydratase [Glaesserella parasuis]MDO9803136.1 myo-inosose-2 dehydratase [Glaesserella parasuis]
MKAENIQLGIAPIGWTNDDLPELGAENTFEQCVSEMALAGYTGCEVGNKYPRDVAVLKHKLDVRGIQICNAWFSTFFVDGKREETIQEFIKHRDFLHAMGAKVIGCSEQSCSIQGTTKAVFKEKPIFNDEDWQRLAEGYNELAKLAAEKGMKVSLHHHMGTGIQTPEEVDRYMSVVNDDVYLLFDSGHLYYSEGCQKAMLAVLEKYIHRIVHVHLKDVRDEVVAEVKAKDLSFLEGVKKGTFTVPGDGVIDFKPIFDILEKYDYKGWMVVEAEQDPALANPFEYALKGRKYIREVAGV